MRTREIEIGDRVHHRCWQSDYEVVAINNGYAWLRTKDASKGVLAALFNLYRIAPDVPKPKFRVGQPIAIKNGQKDHLEIAEIIPLGGFSYRLRCIPHNEGLDGEIVFKGGLTYTTYKEWELMPLPEAVPEVCPTCGGKVADA